MLIVGAAASADIQGAGLAWVGRPVVASVVVGMSAAVARAAGARM
jgi:hypothetical protein